MTNSAPHDADATVRIGMFAVVRTDTIVSVRIDVRGSVCAPL